MSMDNLKSILASLLKSLPQRPIQQSKLDDLVKDAISEAEGKTSIVNRKSLWEYLLKNEIFLHAVRGALAILVVFRIHLSYIF